VIVLARAFRLPDPLRVPRPARERQRERERGRSRRDVTSLISLSGTGQGEKFWLLKGGGKVYLYPMTELFRRDQTDGITAPNLADTSSFAEHIVHARGKHTRYTSVSTDPDTIRDFGPQLWQLLQPKTQQEGHRVVSHDELLTELRRILSTGTDEEKERAVRALPRAKKRREALVEWQFNLQNVERKELMSWAQKHVRPYFTRK
jgi:hypothetical protein